MLMGLGRSIAGRISVQLRGILDACIALKCKWGSLWVFIQKYHAPRIKVRGCIYLCCLNDVEWCGLIMACAHKIS